MIISVIDINSMERSGVGMIRKFNNGGGTLIGVLKDLWSLPTLHTYFLTISYSNEHGTFREQ